MWRLPLCMGPGNDDGDHGRKIKSQDRSVCSGEVEIANFRHDLVCEWVLRMKLKFQVFIRRIVWTSDFGTLTPTHSRYGTRVAHTRREHPAIDRRTRYWPGRIPHARTPKLPPDSIWPRMISPTKRNPSPMQAMVLWSGSDSITVPMTAPRYTTSSSDPASASATRAPAEGALPPERVLANRSRIAPQPPDSSEFGTISALKAPTISGPTSDGTRRVGLPAFATLASPKSVAIEFSRIIRRHRIPCNGQPAPRTLPASSSSFLASPMSSKAPAADNPLTFGERLRQVRQERSLTLSELSNLAKLSVSFLSDIERNRTSPSIQSIRKLASAFGVSPSRLLTGVDLADEAPTWPPGLQELKDDPEYRSHLTDDWMRTLARIQYRGSQPQTKHEWLELFLHLRRVLRQRS